MLAAVALVIGATVPAAAQQDPWAAFQQKNAHDQEHIRERLNAGVNQIDSPWLRSLRACAAETAEAGQPRTAKLSQREPKKKAPAAEAANDAWFPDSIAYRFGQGIVEAAGDAARGTKAEREAADHRIAVRAGLEGMHPEADAALAALLRRMDKDTSADHFAAFLEAWRNGTESFYEALDRTAGTPESVFFYDAMLGDFVNDMVAHKEPGAAELRGSLKRSHDALHRAFLAYRQYRAFREAMALSMVLPPGQKLPARLQRYEARPASGYSLREQVTMVLACEDFDVAKVADLIAGGAAPLPKPLWGAAYEPNEAWTKVFAARTDRMTEAARSTDDFLQRAKDRLEAWSSAVRTAARDAVAAEPAHSLR